MDDGTSPATTEPEPSAGTQPRFSASPLRRAATIYDVAKVARVSHQTVSRFLKGYQGIRPETRDRVERALRELDYRPNLTARSLATSRSHRIGALTHEIEQVGPGKILQGASRGAREAGYLLDIVSFDPLNESDIQRALRIADSSDLAGIIAFASTDGVIEAFSGAGFSVPWFIAGEDDDSIGEHEVTRNGQGVRMLVDHLADLGHVRLLQIAGPEAWISARNRRLAFDVATVARGLREVATRFGDWSPESGYRAALDLPLDQGATALVVANDQMALGAMRALTERGLSIPRDMSVVGFDDIPEAPYFQPPLTTVSLDFDLQGRLSFLQILELIEGPTAQASKLPYQFSPQLVVRASTAPPLR
ncbi:LacI family transcriptional regulator [Frondihabitans sucicola]|uniref:LacI family transcriptional regulator n=1 Tax=Frondihabitans sucicola TaxID=1268041 RepID=A0ABN6Y778_9MICO|nr:LacI family DNA-binding transcriptional regulator [Frondihabitans sucicola]BDZ51856.1 LacI family transcriptional regulator [Frondihabitans sucicola]